MPRLRSYAEMQPMKYLRNILCICATSFVFAPSAKLPARDPASPRANTNRDDKLLKPEAIQGCYELTLSPWFPDLKLGEDEEFITPPRRIQLFATKGTEGREAEGYLVRPAPGIQPSIHRETYWLPKGPKTLEIVWTTGLSGLMMQLKTSDAEILRGKAATFWDFSRKKQTAEVVAQRVDCGKG